MVDEVDVEVAEASAARPEEAVKSADLVLQIGDIRRLGWGCKCAHRASHPIAAHKNDVADLAIFDPVVKLLQRPRVARHEPNTNLQVFRRSFLAELQQAPAGGAIGR